jgi:type II secretory pathway pseudopilin PulG
MNRSSKASKSKAANLGWNRRWRSSYPPHRGMMSHFFFALGRRKRFGFAGQFTAGLTLVESLVAILILLTVISVVLQLMGSTAWLASQAERNDQAMHWIQADVENVKLKAREYEQNAFPYSSRCAGPAANSLAASFITDQLGGTGAVTQGPKMLGGANLVLIRTASYSTSSDPARVVQLSYTVTRQNDGDPIAEFEIEVVPYAAFKCP